MEVAPTAQALNAITHQIIAAAIAVHRELGPGLLEHVYRACLVDELPRGGLTCRCEIPVPVVYRDLQLPCAYRADLLVDEQVIVEVKALEQVMPVHKRQLHTYIQLADRRVGLLLNFGAISMRQGVYRAVYRFPE